MANTEVPGTFEGFSAEEKQAFFELMRNTDDTVEIWIERYDDVAVKKGDDVECIQLKSATSNNNPFANKSAELWKSLSNWVDKLKDAEIASEINICRCRYSVSSPHAFTVGRIVTSFRDAISERDAEDALQEAQSIIKAPTSSIKPFVDNFFALENRAYSINVVRAFSYEYHSEFMKELSQLFHETSSVTPNLEKSLFETMCGWIRIQSAPFTESGNPACILRGSYRNKLASESQRLRENPLSQPIDKPTPEDIEAEKQKLPNYLRQLQLIDMAQDDVCDERSTKAITEKLKSDRHVAILAKDGIISLESFELYRDNMISDWEDIRRDKLLAANTDDISLGQQIYIATRKEIKRNHLQGFEPPRDTAYGQLHGLADEPERHTGVPRIGWHPNYESELIKRISEDTDEE